MGFSTLLTKLDSRQATIAVVGLGYVGLPLAIRFSEESFPVLGVDTDKEKLAALKRGESFTRHISDEKIVSLGDSFVVTEDFSRIADADVIIICVPTPLGEDREPDLGHVVSTIDNMLPHLKKGQAVALESTTYPGTTEEKLVAPLEQAGLKVGDDIAVIYSPEREDVANPSFTTRTIPKVCSGVTPACLAVALKLYGHVVDEVVPVSSPRTAEMTKLLENIHRAVNIGLVNEMKIIADRMDIDIHEVISAASTKPFGFTPYYPGPGLGGHCIPVDPFYLSWKARQHGVDARFIELAGEINNSMPGWVVDKVVSALEQRQKTPAECRALVLGVAFKKNVDDMRESPSVEILRLLHNRGFTVEYSDPFVPRLQISDMPAMESRTLDGQCLGEFDVVVLATDHDSFDYDLVAEACQLLVDTRGRFDSRHNIVKA